MPAEPTVTDQAVKALRAALAEWECGCLCDDRLRAGLAAAAPHIAAQALRDAADLVDRGPAIPLPPSVYSALLRERADALADGPRSPVADRPMQTPQPHPERPGDGRTAGARGDLGETGG